MAENSCLNCRFAKPNGPFPRMLIDCIRYPQVVSKTIPSVCGEYQPGTPIYLETVTSDAPVSVDKQD